MLRIAHHHHARPCWESRYVCLGRKLQLALTQFQTYAMQQQQQLGSEFHVNPTKVNKHSKRTESNLSKACLKLKGSTADVNVYFATGSAQEI